MKTLKVHLLTDNRIIVGEIPNSENLLHSFYLSDGLSDLERFLQLHKEEAEYFNQAFAYWIICSLGRCKEEINKYGVLTRKLIHHSKKLWKKLRSFAKKIAIRIRVFQRKNCGCSAKKAPAILVRAFLIVY